MLSPGRATTTLRLRMLAAALVLFVLVFGFGARPDPALYPPAPGAPAVTVWVVDNGFHSDLVLPTERLRARRGASTEALQTLPPAPYVTIGWGDARFFVDTSPVRGRLLDGLRALFAPDNPALIRYEPLTRPPAQAYDETVLELRLSPQGFERLAERLDRSFTPNVRLAPPYPRAALEPRYFESRERFSLVHLCNDWTGKLLAAAGVPRRPLLDVLSPGLSFDLESGAKAKKLR